MIKSFIGKHVLNAGVMFYSTDDASEAPPHAWFDDEDNTWNWCDGSGRTDEQRAAAHKYYDALRNEVEDSP